MPGRERWFVGLDIETAECGTGTRQELLDSALGDAGRARTMHELLGHPLTAERLVR